MVADHPADIKAAGLVIEKSGDQFTLNNLEAAYISARNDYARNKLLTLVMQYQRWVSLGFLLRMYKEYPDSAMLSTKLQQWLKHHRKRQIFTKPPKQLLADLPDAIRLMKGDAANSGLVEEFQWLLER